MARPAVKHTVEFDRVVALPRRVLNDVDSAAWAAVFTDELRDPRAVNLAPLLPEQGIVLAEALENNGAWVALPVGTGKTLLTYLLPVVFDAKRPLLIAPAAARDKTWADFASYEGQWRSPRAPIRFMSREDLANPKSVRFLHVYRPDLVMCDEGDELSNAIKGAPARLDRYRVDNQDAVFVVLTGTPTRNSIMGYWHILGWCLPETMPLPMVESEACTWAAALDERHGRAFDRVLPGPLGATREAALEWYSRRLTETPGVIIIDKDSCEAPLTFRWRFAKEDPALDAAYERFLTREENPGGMLVTDPLRWWLLDGQMGCGLYSYFDPEPPEEWRDAYREFAKFVRVMIARSRTGSHPLDTESMVVRRFKTHPTVERWLAIKPTFKPHTRHQWITHSAVESAVEWLHESREPGIVWTGCVEYGLEVAHKAGVPYFGRLGKSNDGRSLHNLAPNTSLVASWGANKRIFNLQPWARQLITMMPQSAKYVEQIVGRSHRRGQDKHVMIDVLMGSGGTIDAFEGAIRESLFGKASTTLTQKILRAEIIRARPAITKANHYRWASRWKGRAEELAA